MTSHFSSLASRAGRRGTGLALSAVAFVLGGCAHEAMPSHVVVATAAPAIVVVEPQLVPTPPMPDAAGTVVSPADGVAVITPVAPGVLRLRPYRPDALAAVHYGNLGSVSTDFGGVVERRPNLTLAQGDVEWSIQDKNRHVFPMLRMRRTGDMYRIDSAEGGNYTIVLRNLSGRTYEVVATVDGRDVISGRPGGLQQRGYVLRPLSTLSIAGFRATPESAGAPATAEPKPFRFDMPTLVPADTGASTAARDVGVLGLALYELALSRRDPFPADIPFVQDASVPLSNVTP